MLPGLYDKSKIIYIFKSYSVNLANQPFCNQWWEGEIDCLAIKNILLLVAPAVDGKIEQYNKNKYICSINSKSQ